MSITIPSHLSDADLDAALSRWRHDERRSTAQLVGHLAEFDARRLHLKAGFSSLFAYCIEVLGLSEHGAYNRIEAARAARRFPTILERLQRGSLNLATVRLLVPHLTEESHRQLLDAAAGHTKRDVEELLARRFPRPDVPSSIRKVPERRPVVAPEPSLATRMESPPPLAPAQAIVPPPAIRLPRVTALSTDRYEVRFTARAETRAKLKLAQDLLRHAVPNGDPAEIFDRALTAPIDALSRKKLAIVRKPARAQRPSASASRHAPAEVKRTVWERDGGTCAFVGQGGRRCNEPAWLEFHHVKPFAAGGETSGANLQLRCRAHNAYEAELFYGPIRSNSPRGEFGAGP